MSNPKQAEIPGTERPRNKKVEAKAHPWRETKLQIKKLQAKEKLERAELIEVCRKEGVSVYADHSVTPPLLLAIEPGAVKVKITEIAEASAAESEGGFDA